MSKTTQNTEDRTMTIRNLSEVELELVAGGSKQGSSSGTSGNQKGAGASNGYGDMIQNPDPDDPSSWNG